ncbi:response regulator [Nocardioides anomalus]|uniref:histidine kinase n=1 Tax=Nocardioides anomalus TaxID=2712223 RepID=A0A6G6WEN4_9ACTN|nr:ATP-binding protein [Nocardioides anomalus]QIG43666.1 response regulator [Nocardioides anomalus]
MATTASVTHAQRRFRRTAVVVAAVAAVFVVLLTPLLPQSAREQVSGAGLLVAGFVGTVLVYRRSRIGPPAARRPWQVLVTAGVVAIVGNIWVAATGSDPSTDPSLVSITSLAYALVVSIIALAIFPVRRRRGAELAVTLLDGVVAGGAFLLIVSATAFSALLESDTATTTVDQVTGVAFPVLDVLLATVAVLLVVRAAPQDRLMLAMVAVAYLLYATSDLQYAVRTNRGDFYFGTVLDLGWILGYLLLGLAATTPPRDEAPRSRIPASVSDALGTTLVFTVLVAATLVQVLVGGSGQLLRAQSVLWVVIMVAAGVRQVLLTTDNNLLRHGLERRVEEQTADLRRLARQNEVLVTSVGDGVYGVDHQGRVTFVNPSGAAALGYRPEELEGRRAHDVFHAPAADGTPYAWSQCYVFEAITHGLVASSEEDEYVRADGSVFPVEITASPLVDGDEVRGAVVVFRDVTQRREVDRMKDEFLSVVSHELRTPLTSIRGSLGLLAGGRMGELPERAGKLIDVASQSTERLTRLINDLLDIERMESGTRPMELTSLDARHLLDSAVRQIEGMGSQLGVRVEVADAHGRVQADEDRVIQTLLNLVGNALKFSERGAVVRLEAAEEGDEVHFRVSDDGRGIPADKLESVFERFQQVDSSDTRQKGGTGLGLAISKGIVERHGGRIWIESELGVGTTVHFTLPAAARRTADPVPPGGGGDGPTGPTVLVCDDDATVVEQFAEMLREHGYRPVGVTDGEQAIDLARSQRPSAVVLDLMMPGTTGAQVMSTLRSSPQTRDIPIVVISGMGPEADRDAAGAADGWLVKPVSEERLVTAVSLVMKDHVGEGVVLLVEDDEQLAQVVSTLLADEGLRVVPAASAAEAIERGAQERPDVIVLDIRLPRRRRQRGRHRVQPPLAPRRHPRRGLQRRRRGPGRARGAATR